MFTGIIQGLGTLVDKRTAGGGMIFVLEADFALTDPEEGESIAVNGACLTARDIRGNRFCVDVSPESLSRTGLGRLQVGSRVNLERALRLSDRLGGHLVSGHVDAQGRVEERRSTGDFTLFTFSLDPGLTRYIIEKGSIAIDGVSLTVATVDSGSFQVSIIPHTGAETILLEKKLGDTVNLECDIIGKYVEKLLGLSPKTQTKQSNLSEAFLQENGFF